MYNDNLNNMMCLDIYLAYSSDAEYRQMKHRIRPLNFQPHPVMSRGMICENFAGVNLNYRETDLQELKKFYEKYLWQINLDKILSEDYEALILTDAQQTIQWVNSGFKKMTGYMPADAIGRSPKFLQGKNTSALSRKRLKKGLSSGKSFTGAIINYRKNGEEYVCMVHVYPLLDHENNLTHFLALEKEI